MDGYHVMCLRMLLYHTHHLQKSASYFLDAPSLPPEELEPPPEKVHCRNCMHLYGLNYDYFVNYHVF